MMTDLRKFLLFSALLAALLPLKSAGQDLTGIWRGYFKTADGEEYKYELQIEQTRSNRISGVSYSYLDTRFYGKATLSGSFIRTSQSALIQEIKTVEVKMAGGSVACIMKCLFNYSKSGKEEFLEGSFTSMYEKTNPLMGVNRGGNCGGGTLFLRKVPTSDFYIEPFLRNKTQPKKDIAPPVAQSHQKPVTPPPAVKKHPLSKPSGQKPPVASKTHTITEPRKDTVSRITVPMVVQKPKETPSISLPATTRSRANELVKTLIVNDENISIRLYDNGEVDGDTISVYLDGHAVVSNKGLSTQPITLNIKLDEATPDHVLVMVAENMGRIPPNTSLMIVQDGDKRYEVSITSTEQKNAMVRFRYEKK